MKVAIVYDRVNKWGGAERVLLTLNRMFPDAPLYTSLYDAKKASWADVFPKVYSSFLQKIPFAKGNHEFLPVFMPVAFESFNFDKYDLVISVTSEAAKGIITKPGTIHICYCLTPTRYLWSGYDEYFKNPILRFISKPFVMYLKAWDLIASNRPDEIISISTAVKERIKKYYEKESDVIFPPFKSLNNGKNKRNKGDYYLIVSRLVSYKKVDLAIEAFNKLKLPLYIVGSGHKKNNLQALAKNNIKFFGQVSEDKLQSLYAGANALIMPQEEEYGLVSLEAQSFGVPVIAYKKGGALDTVISDKTGVFFEDQTTQSLIAAIEKFEKMIFNDKLLSSNAKKFSEEVFKKRLQGALVRIIGGRRRRNSSLAGI